MNRHRPGVHVRDSAKLPLGPSGRKPEAGIRLRFNSLNIKILTLFEDGSYGIWVKNNRSEKYDGSEYEMIVHSPDAIGKIEYKEYSSRMSTLFFLCSIFLACSYLTLTLYVRFNYDWPDWFPENTWTVFYVLLFIPFLLVLIDRKLLKISGGEITIFVSNSDPYRFPVQSHNIEIFTEIVGYLLFLCFSWIFLLDADEYNLERIWISIIW